tara:strand:- start:387 stop:734 length:348 start_codon:yes stop_codon:yes gene_type:complete
VSGKKKDTDRAGGRHTTGDVCEAILTEYLLRRGWFVLRPITAHGPVDVAAITPEGDMYLFDSKNDRKRINLGRKKADRIYRIRTNLQKKLGVRIAYVDMEKREIWIVPAIPLRRD